jgi:hypothetical protein
MSWINRHWDKDYQEKAQEVILDKVRYSILDRLSTANDARKYTQSDVQIPSEDGKIKRIYKLNPSAVLCSEGPILGGPDVRLWSGQHGSG